MKIATHTVDRDTMMLFARQYAKQYSATITIYDLGGDGDGKPGPKGGAEPLDRVTLADLGRLVVFNARLQARDVPALLRLGKDDVLDETALPPESRLEDCRADSDLYVTASTVYEHFRAPGISKAKKSKLLHMKRPWLIPIHDSRTDQVYRPAAVELGQSTDGKPQFWEAFRRDLTDGAKDLTWLREQLSSSDSESERRMSRLTSLRLLDVVAWSLSFELN